MATTLSRCRPLPEPTVVDLGIAGRKALLIGASRGLGKACALALAKEGVDVTIMARTRDVLERTCEEIGAATGVKAVPVVGDIITVEGRQAAIAACPAPDILLNNADGPLPGDFRNWTRADWISALDAMMLGPIEMIRLTIDGMIDRGFGRIINIVSRSVKIPSWNSGYRMARVPDWWDLWAALRVRLSRAMSPSTIFCPAFSTAMRSAGTSKACRRRTAGHLTRSGRRERWPIRRNDLAGRPNSARIAHFFARNMPASLPGRTF